MNNRMKQEFVKFICEFFCIKSESEHIVYDAIADPEKTLPKDLQINPIHLAWIAYQQSERKPRLISDYLEPDSGNTLYGLACRHMRLELDITISELSKKIGHHVPTISGIECNRRPLTVEYIDKVERVFGTLPRCFANVSYSDQFDALPDEAKKMILEIHERRTNASWY